MGTGQRSAVSCPEILFHTVWAGLASGMPSPGWDLPSSQEPAGLAPTLSGHTDPVPGHLVMQPTVTKDKNGPVYMVLFIVMTSRYFL